MQDPQLPRSNKSRRIAWLIILFILCVISIWVPLYNRVEPELFGIPFFYWFQFTWVIVAAAVTAVAYRAGL